MENNQYSGNMDPFKALGAKLNADEKERRNKERKRKNSEKYRKKKKARELERDQTLKRLNRENQELKEKVLSLERHKKETEKLVKQLRNKVTILEVQSSLQEQNST